MHYYNIFYCLTFTRTHCFFLFCYLPLSRINRNNVCINSIRNYHQPPLSISYEALETISWESYKIHHNHRHHHDQEGKERINLGYIVVLLIVCF